MHSPYVYIIQHIYSGKNYIGCRYARKCHSSELLTENGYRTSSNIIKKMIKEEGLDSFRILKIFECADRNDALELETFILEEVDAKSNSEYLNMHNNESEKNRQKLCEEYDVTSVAQIPEVRAKLSASRQKYLKENPDHFDKISKKMKGRWSVNNGEPMKEETKLLISKSNKKYYEEHPDAMRGENHPNYNKPMKEEQKKKLSESLIKFYKENKIICPHCGKEGSKPQMIQHHFDNCKNKN